LEAEIQTKFETGGNYNWACLFMQICCYRGSIKPN